MKGLFRKIVGVTGVIAVVGIIVMVAISPRAEGFFPDLLSFRKTAEPVRAETPAVVAEPEPAPEPEPESVSDSLPQPVVDTLPGGMDRQ